MIERSVEGAKLVDACHGSEADTFWLIDMSRFPGSQEVTVTEQSGPPMPTRTELETSGFGICVRVEVAEGTDVQALVDALFAHLRELSGRSSPDPENVPEDEEPDDDGLVFGHLRLVVFAEDLRSAIFHWQRQLGLPEDVSDSAEGIVAGKVLHWGDGSPDGPFAIAFFQANVAYGLIEGTPLARALVAHEMAHLHLGLVLRRHLGPGVKDPVAGNDWPAIRRHLAINCFDEFYAEHVASTYIDEAGVHEAESLLVTLAAGSLERVRERVATYRHDGDIAAMWGASISEISSFTNQIGRALGLRSGGDVNESLASRLDAVAPTFGSHLRDMHMAVRPIMEGTYDDLSLDSFVAMETVIEKVFSTFGVIPKWDGEQLGVDVPFWPGDQERAEREHYARQGVLLDALERLRNSTL